MARKGTQPLKPVVLFFALLIASLADAADLPRLGVLSFTQVTPAMQDALRSGLREHGYVENRNLVIEWRAAEGRVDRAKTLAAELVSMNSQVIVAMLTPAVQAAKEATATIPIVMAPAGDPVATGFVASLARPGGNITGIAGQGAEISGKRVALLRELLPKVESIGLLTNGADPFVRPFIDEHRAVAKKVGLRLRIADVRRPQDVESALAGLARDGAAAVVVQGVLTGQAWQVGPLSMRHKLIAVSNLRQFADNGGFFSYGANSLGIYRRAASYVDRILKGAKAAELPVELPTEFELVVNMKVARALGVTIPPSVLVRVDELIQ